MPRFGVTSIGGARVSSPNGRFLTVLLRRLLTTVRAAREADMLNTLPGLGPVLPRKPIDRGKLLLARTRVLIDLRAQVRQLERECEEIIKSLYEGAA
jgi:hypothetical protein